MRYETSKIAVIIKNSDDLEQVKSLALRLASLLVNHCCPSREANNYTVCSVFGSGEVFRHVTGTRDYCIGYIEGDDNRRTENAVICIDNTIIWPEDRFGDLLEGE